MVHLEILPMKLEGVNEKITKHRLQNYVTCQADGAASLQGTIFLPEMKRKVVVWRMTINKCRQAVDLYT